MWKVNVSLESLCSVINHLQSYCLESIHFFHGQDDKCNNNSVIAFWMVLHNLLCNDACKDFVDCTKLNFARKGYKGLYFYLLPNDSSQGSRELLLALTWLISQNIIEEKINTLVLQLLERKQSPSVKQETDMKFETKELGPKLDYLMYKSTQFQHSHRSYLINCSERNKLLSQIKVKMEEKTPYITLIDGYYNKILPESLNNTIAVFPLLLNSYFSWKSQEKKYYHWIKGVVHKKLEGDRRIIDDVKTANAVKLKLLLKNEITKNISVSTMKYQQILNSEYKISNLNMHKEKLSKLANCLGLILLK